MRADIAPGSIPGGGVPGELEPGIPEQPIELRPIGQPLRFRIAALHSLSDLSHRQSLHTEQGSLGKLERPGCRHPSGIQLQGGFLLL